MMRAEVKDTLKNLQSRLTNINRRNRMLYLSKPVVAQYERVVVRYVARIVGGHYYAPARVFQRDGEQHKRSSSIPPPSACSP